MGKQIFQFFFFSNFQKKLISLSFFLPVVHSPVKFSVFIMRSNLSILNQLFFFIFVILCVSTVNSEDCEQELTDALFKTWVTIEVKSYNGGQIGIGMKFESKGTTYQEMTTQFSGNLEFPVYFFGIIWNSDIFIALYFYKTPKPALLLVHP